MVCGHRPGFETSFVIILVYFLRVNSRKFPTLNFFILKVGVLQYLPPKIVVNMKHVTEYS